MQSAGGRVVLHGHVTGIPPVPQLQLDIGATSPIVPPNTWILVLVQLEHIGKVQPSAPHGMNV
jgi:hypothetical protein